jgi:hypothetical protein
VAQPEGPTAVLELTANSYSESFQQLRPRGAEFLPASALRGLVGIHLGTSSGPFEISRLQVHLPPDQKARNYCVRIATVDGRYWSRNAYRRSSDKDALGYIETRSKIGSLLARAYTSSDVVVRVVESASCNDDLNGAVVPVVLPGSLRTESLFVYVNAPGDLVAARVLDMKDRAIATGNCRADDTAIMYTESCEIPVRPNIVNQATKLQVEIIGSSDKPFVYDLRLAN